LERAYLSLLGFATLREVVFEEVNLEQLQVEFRVEEKTPKMTRTSGEITIRNLVPGGRPIGIPPEFAT
jgi:hypothetical protein